MSDQSDELYDQALALLQGGDVSAALAKLEECLMEEPRDPLTWRLYGMALTAAGRADDAATALGKAESFGEGGVDDLTMKAAQAQMEGNPGAAISYFEDALELEEGRGELWAAYAIALMEGGYRKDALEASEKATSLGAEDAHAWYARGRILRLTDAMAEALPAFERAVALDPKAAVAWYERGMVQVELGDLEGATASFERVLALQPGDPAAAQALDIVRARRG